MKIRTMLTRGFCKFIKKQRVFCEANPACLCYGTRVVQFHDGSIHLFCDKHVTAEPRKQK